MSWWERQQGWEQALHAEAVGADRVWQKGVALLWMCNCVLRMTGTDPLSHLPAEAGMSRIKVARQMDLPSLAAAMQWEEIAPTFAKRGDVVLVEGLPGVVALDGRRAWVVRKGKRRPGASDMKHATRAWRIG